MTLKPPPKNFAHSAEPDSRSAVKGKPVLILNVASL